MLNSLDYILVGIGVITLVAYLCLFFYYLFKDRPKFIALLVLTSIYIALAFLYSFFVYIVELLFPINSLFTSIIAIIGLFVLIIGINTLSGNRLMSWYIELEKTLGRKIN